MAAVELIDDEMGTIVKKVAMQWNCGTSHAWQGATEARKLGLGAHTEFAPGFDSVTTAAWG